MSDPNAVVLAEILRGIQEQAKVQKDQAAQIGKLAWEMGTTREIVEKIDARQDKQDETLSGHMKHEEEVLNGIRDAQEQLRKENDALSRGFPRHPKTGERDPGYHADGHEDEQDAKQDRKELMKKVREWAVLGILAIICTGIGALLLSGAKVEVKRAVSDPIMEERK